MYETIQYTVQNGVATLELSRPDKLNAFNSQMIYEIITAVKEASKDEQVRCLVFTGASRGFCSGQDLADVDENMGENFLLDYRFFHDILHHYLYHGGSVYMELPSLQHDGNGNMVPRIKTFSIVEGELN